MGKFRLKSDTPKDLLNIIHDHNGGVAYSVCSVCSDIGGWKDRIDIILEHEYPQWLNRNKGIPANDSVWCKFKALWKEHEVPCLVFSYDDWSFAICKNHLNTIAKFFTKPRDMEVWNG